MIVTACRGPRPACRCLPWGLPGRWARADPPSRAWAVVPPGQRAARPAHAIGSQGGRRERQHPPMRAFAACALLICARHGSTAALLDAVLRRAPGPWAPRSAGEVWACSRGYHQGDTLPRPLSVSHAMWVYHMQLTLSGHGRKFVTLEPSVHMRPRGNGPPAGRRNAAWRPRPGSR